MKKQTVDVATRRKGRIFKDQSKNLGLSYVDIEHLDNDQNEYNDQEELDSLNERQSEEQSVDVSDMSQDNLLEVKPKRSMTKRRSGLRLSNVDGLKGIGVE